MSDNQLRLPQYAVDLTKAFQVDAGARRVGTAFSNALLIVTSLMDDELSGDMPVVSGKKGAENLTIANLFREISVRPAVKATLDEDGPVVNVTGLLSSDMSHLQRLSSYVKENGFPENNASLPNTYLLVVAAASEVYRRYGKDDGVELHVASNGKIQPRLICLDR